MSDPRLIVTTSWDDGHPADRRLGELLTKYGIAGTFYVPTRNSEGRQVMGKADVAVLAQSFEVGGHTLDHVILTALATKQATHQIESNKQWLEEITGERIDAFCYPRGRYNEAVKKIVRLAGFKTARTIQNLSSRVGNDPLEVPTTLQFFPHRRDTYLKNLLKGGSRLARAGAFVDACLSNDLPDRVRRLVDLCARNGRYFHLWGHSWEIEDLNLWNELEDTLKHLSTAFSQTNFLTNQEAVRALQDT